MQSKRFLTWKAKLDLKTCPICRGLHGKIYGVDEWIEPEPPLHYKCRCAIKSLEALIAGTATNKGFDGADWWLKKYGRLPDYYITEEEAKNRGWKPRSGNLLVVVPGKMITKGIYENRNGHLPTAPRRIWFEADINYIVGERGLSRIVFSNDGLIFVTYDHYKIFYEIIKEEIWVTK